MQWIAVAKKVDNFATPEIASDYWTAQMLGVVDYDFDKNDGQMTGGLAKASSRTAEMACRLEGPMRGTAWVGLLTMVSLTT